MPRRLHAGELREDVTIRQRTLVDDGAGGHTETLSDLATVPARVRPATLRDRLVSRSVAGAEVDYEVTIRARPDVTATMFLLWTPKAIRSMAQKTLEIRALSLEPSRDSLRLMCLERL